MSQQPEQTSCVERVHKEEQEINQNEDYPHQENQTTDLNTQKLNISDLVNNELVLQKQDSIQKELDKRAAADTLIPKLSNNNSMKVSILINGEIVQESTDKSTIQPPEKYETKSCSVNLNACSEETKEINDIPRSISSHSPIISSEVLSVTASPSSELSGSAQMLSYMNKQQSRRDMKNWLHGRSLGGFTVRSSLPENKVTSYDQIETPKKLSSHTDHDSSFDHEEVSVSSKFVKYGESFCSPARTIGSSKSKKIIKISNSISSELKQQDFKDDEMIEVDESAYQSIVRNYDISKNISVSIKSLISNPTKDSNNVTDPKKITIPVLISVKTAEQAMSFSSLKEQEDEEESALQENILNRLSHLGINQIALEEGSSSSGEYHEDDEEASCEGIEGISNLVAKIEEKEHKQEQSDDIEEENESEEDQEDKDKEEGIDNKQQQQQQQQTVQTQVQESPNRKTSVEEDCSKEDELKNKQQTISDTTGHDTYYNEKEQNVFVFDEEQDNMGIHKAKKSLFKAESIQSTSTQPQTQSPVAQRFPIDLICVIDTSGSMNGEPLALVKETLLFLIELLQNGDRICLIQFSTNARRLTPLLSISKKGNRELMREEIQRLIAKGGTNINQGMQVAFDVLKQRRFKNAITSVFLLSDGLNDGAEHRIQDLLKMMNFYQNYSEVSFTIQTFGFGKDHDPALMDKISQLMDGNFYYIADIHRLDECFIDALGGLFSVVSQNVDIRIRVPRIAREKVRIVKTFGQIWNPELESYEYRININQLFSGVSKDYVLELEIDPNILISEKKKLEANTETKNDSNEGNNGEAQKQENVFSSCEDILHNILETELTASSIRLKADKTPKQNFTNKQVPQNLEILGGNNMDQIPKEPQEEQVNHEQNNEQLQKQDNVQPSDKIEHLDELNSQHSAEKSIEGGSEKDYTSEENIQKVVKVTKLDLSINSFNDKEVQLHYLRVKSAEGLERCQTLAVAKKFDEGSELVKKLLAELKASPPETLVQLSKLVGDLKEAAEALKKKVGEQIGWHRMISCKRMHMEQRSAGTDLAYQNSVQKLMVQKRQTFKNQLLNPNSLNQIYKEQQYLSPIQPFNQIADETYLDHVKDTQDETTENDQNSASLQSQQKELEHPNNLD